MMINGLPLPTLLCHLVEAETWKRPDDAASLRKLANVDNPEDFSFLDFDGMKRETNAARAIAADVTTARLYGLKPTAEREKPHADDELIDIARAVMIAVNWDEDAIFLDYRPAMGPTVVLSSWSDNARSVGCRQIAANFDEFARRLGLLSQQE